MEVTQMDGNQKENAVTMAIENSADPKGTEYDLVKSLLKATKYRESEQSVKKVDIRRDGIYLFTVHLHPVGDEEVRIARKKATKYGKNPQGSKYPKIELDYNSGLFNSWLIYLATTPEDQEKIWGNPAIKKECDLMENVDGVDALLSFGEKVRLADLISEISGLGEEEPSDEELAKN